MRSSDRPERGPRAVAYRVLVRVAASGAYASLALDAAIARAGLDARDARLATAIVYGTLRELSAIDAIVDAKLARKSKLDDAARAALRASVFQLAGMERQPAHAVVDDAVRWVRAERDPRVGGFVNAVLRKIVADAPRLAKESIALDPEVRAMLVRSIGEARTARVCAPATPSIDLRARDASARDALADAIARARPRGTVLRTRYSPLGVRAYRVGDPRELPGASTGELVVQEEGSQIIAALVGARPGERVLDVCAGRGGKTTFLGLAVGQAGSVVATDLHEHRLEQLEREWARLGLPAPLETRAVDWTVGAGGLAGPFDRILVDAPCSGLGTVARRPEIAARLVASTVRELAGTQRAILGRAATLLAPGGTLLYAVCSLLDDESVDVVRDGMPQGLAVRAFTSGETFGIDPEEDGSLVLGPFLDDDGGGTDGYRIFRLARVDRVGIGS